MIRLDWNQKLSKDHQHPNIQVQSMIDQTWHHQSKAVPKKCREMLKFLRSKRNNLKSWLATVLRKLKSFFKMKCSSKKQSTSLNFKLRVKVELIVNTNHKSEALKRRRRNYEKILKCWSHKFKRKIWASSN